MLVTWLWCVFSSRRRHTRCALVTGVQTCALPIYRAQQDPECGVEHPGRDRHPQRVVEEREGEVLLHIGHGGLGDLPGAQDAAQVALDQGDLDRKSVV